MCVCFFCHVSKSNSCVYNACTSIRQLIFFLRNRNIVIGRTPNASITFFLILILSHAFVRVHIKCFNDFLQFLFPLIFFFSLHFFLCFVILLLNEHFYLSNEKKKKMNLMAFYIKSCFSYATIVTVWICSMDGNSE